MSCVRPFNKERLIEYLKSNGLRYSIDQDGEISTSFGHDGIDFRVHLLARGADESALCLVGTRARGYGADQRADCLEACNRWNLDHRSPTVCLHTDDSGQSFVVTGWNVELDQGVHQELLKDMIDSFLRSNFRFWEWMREERDLF